MQANYAKWSKLLHRVDFSVELWNCRTASEHRDWPSVINIILALDERLGRDAVGWKVGAASEEVRRAEGLPSASPGRIYTGTVFPSGTVIGPEFFINYRNIECEFAFQLGLDFPVRDRPYEEADIRAAIEVLFPVLELGDSVFPDWDGAACRTPGPP